MTELLLERALPLAMCTIYEPPFPDMVRRRAAATALATLNDVITRHASKARATLIDLRLICNREEDFANPIEPSAKGGAKIARAIAMFARRDQPTTTVLANS